MIEAKQTDDAFEAVYKDKYMELQRQVTKYDLALHEYDGLTSKLHVVVHMFVALAIIVIMFIASHFSAMVAAIVGAVFGAVLASVEYYFLDRITFAKAAKIRAQDIDG